MLLASAVFSSGCDLGPRDDAPGHGPALHLLASYPTDGQGTNAPFGADVTCDEATPDCAVPTNAAIELRFDRFLLPGVGLTAGLSLYSGNPPANGVALQAEYDMLERVAVFRPTRALQPNTLYTAVLVPSANPGRGFWAFDRAPLEEGAVPLRFSFSTGGGPRSQPALPMAPSDSCQSMPNGPLSRCVSCHASKPDAHTTPPSDFPPMGLDLSSARGLFVTAISHVAHETETGDSAVDEGLQSPLRFGVQMNVVDPGSPATSYLMYKLLQKPENFALTAEEPTCVTGYHAPVSDLDCQPPPEEERVRLREWLVLGDPMPKDGTSSTGQPIPAAITRQDLVRISGWIATGASCPAPH